MLPDLERGAYTVVTFFNVNRVLRINGVRGLKYKYLIVEWYIKEIEAKTRIDIK